MYRFVLWLVPAGAGRTFPFARGRRFRRVDRVDRNRGAGGGAQHWSLDARRIALGGVGGGNLASELVAERRGYRTLVLPFGLVQSLSDLGLYKSLGDPDDASFDPIRALELLASPLHYTFARSRPSSEVRTLVRDLANGEVSRELGVYRTSLPERILWEGLVSPNWGRTFVLSGERHGFFQGVYVGAGPYLSADTDTRIDPDLIATYERIIETDGDLPANVSFYSNHATAVQAAAAVTGGYRARFPLPGRAASDRDAIHVAADYHYLYGFGFLQTGVDLDFTTDAGGLLDTGIEELGFYEHARSRSGRGMAVDAGMAIVIGRVDIGVGARGLGNRLKWTDLRGERVTAEVSSDGSLSGESLSWSGREVSTLYDALRVELPVDYTADVAYHADGWSALAAYGNGFFGHRLHVGGEFRLGWIDLRAGGRFLRDRWHPSVGVGFNGSTGPSLDIALFGGSANVARTRTLAIAASVRLNADTLLASFPGVP